MSFTLEHNKNKLTTMQDLQRCIILCKDCQTLSGLILELDRVAIASSFHSSFLQSRTAWRTACRNVQSHGDLVHCLSWFEQGVKPELINTKWKERREDWEEKLLSASNCHMVALALYDFESHMLWKAVLDDWRKERKLWARSVRGLYPPTLRVLSDCLLCLEKSTKYEVISQRWRGERAKWMHRACYCRCIEELSAAAILFVGRLLAHAMTEQWLSLRTSWSMQLKSVPMSCSLLASLLLTLEQHMLASSLGNKWQEEYRSDWVITLQNIAAIGR
jgi:hypothetical protein